MYISWTNKGLSIKSFDSIINMHGATTVKKKFGSYC